MDTTRYIRQTALPEIGKAGQEKLAQAKVLVIGAGGLGCPVLQNFAGMGIGTIGIVDGDTVSESNLHRQLLYTQDDCGKSKAITASKAIQKINPLVQVQIFPDFLVPSNANQIIPNYDIIVDCTDDIPIRYLINDMAVTYKIPVVYASLHKFQGQLSVFNYKEGPSYRCLFPEEENSSAPTCATTGILGVLPNILGILQAAEVVKIILSLGEILSGKLLIYNALDQSMSPISFSKQPHQIERALKNGKEILSQTTVAIKTQINTQEFLDKCFETDQIIIDVREINEKPKLSFPNIITIPLSELEENCQHWNKNENYTLFCQSGKRSTQAQKIMQANGFVNVCELKNGIQSLQDFTLIETT